MFFYRTAILTHTHTTRKMIEAHQDAPTIDPCTMAQTDTLHTSYITDPLHCTPPKLPKWSHQVHQPTPQPLCYSKFFCRFFTKMQKTFCLYFQNKHLTPSPNAIRELLTLLQELQAGIFGYPNQCQLE